MAYHILAVDDAAVILTLLTDLLTEEGYRVSTSDTRITTLASWDANPPDLVILDNCMAGERVGLETIGLIRANPRYQNLPILLLTGSRGSTKLRIEIANLPRVELALKPFGIDELLGHISRLIMPAITPAPQTDNIFDLCLDFNLSLQPLCKLSAK